MEPKRSWKALIERWYAIIERVKTDAGYQKRCMQSIALLVAAACGIGYIVYYYHGLDKQEAQYEALRVTEVATEAVAETATEAVAAEPETEATEQVETATQLYDFEALRGENEDIYAWITVPGTQVDYPVLQSEEDNYYLEHNLDRSSGYPGCIYTNKVNLKDFTDYNTVLYGHNMKNGSMFGCLHDYEDQEFFEDHREIVVYTEDKKLTYQIFAAVKFTDVYIPAYYDLTAADGRDAFLSALKEESTKSDVSHYDETVEIQPEDKLITLSTCVNGERPKRWLTVGKLIKELPCEAE